MAEAEQLRGGFDGDPGLLAQFGLELSVGPAGIANEGADEGAGVLGMFDGVRRRNAGGESEAFFVGPPQGCEGEVFARDGTSDVHGDSGEGGELLVLEELSDPVAGRMIEDESEGAFVGAVLGEEDDGPVEDAVAQGGVGDEKLALEANRRFLPGGFGHRMTLELVWGGVKRGGKAGEAGGFSALPGVDKHEGAARVRPCSSIIPGSTRRRGMAETEW